MPKTPQRSRRHALSCVEQTELLRQRNTAYVNERILGGRLEWLAKHSIQTFHGKRNTFEARRAQGLTDDCPPRTCPDCGGEGCIDDRRPWQDPQLDWRKACPRCSGLGTIYEEEPEDE